MCPLTDNREPQARITLTGGDCNDLHSRVVISRSEKGTVKAWTMHGGRRRAHDFAQAVESGTRRPFPAVTTGRRSRKAWWLRPHQPRPALHHMPQRLLATAPGRTFELTVAGCPLEESTRRRPIPDFRSTRPTARGALQSFPRPIHRPSPQEPTGPARGLTGRSAPPLFFQTEGGNPWRRDSEPRRRQESMLVHGVPVRCDGFAQDTTHTYTR
jgi:hypothetical protein